jgi:hypothetical protein
LLLEIEATGTSACQDVETTFDRADLAGEMPIRWTTAVKS